MSDPIQSVSLWRELATVAEKHADNPAGAVAALMRAASAILQRDLGEEAAAVTLLEIVADATSKMNGGSGLVVTKH